MRNNLRFTTVVAFSLLIFMSLPGLAQAESAGNSIESKFATVEGIKIHYLTAGHGPAVILLHGYTGVLTRKVLNRLLFFSLEDFEVFLIQADNLAVQWVYYRH